jgi:glycosyltransferase involved in cell wall biosynthesis
MRTALLIAYHFPPLQGSSGMQRTLRFAQHLPSFGWRPIVLTIDPRAYANKAEVAGNEVPPGLLVHRSFGFDTARHLSLFGRYPGLLALPDRWATWRFWAVRDALRLIKQHDVEVVWSTFPIATAHEIGLAVARRSGLPWIAEFRDPMWQGEDYPSDPRTNRYWMGLEARIFGRADRVVVTTPGAMEEYAGRFPGLDSARIELIENGYDEETFQRAEASLRESPPPPRDPRGPITLLHSGIVYPSERDPTQLFQAIANLKQRGQVSAASLQVVLRASGYDATYQPMLDSFGIADIVRLEPSVDYLAALREMLTADGLLLLQASNCNAQVPAKLYEYLRTRRPILALTDPAGDTARSLQTYGLSRMARLDSVSQIEQSLTQFIDTTRSATWPDADLGAIASRSRHSQAAQLARLMTSLT